jgi:photosystem II stability/assembly factor-like uncharacterized protein
MRTKGLPLLILAIITLGIVAFAAEKPSDSPWKLVVESRITHKSNLAGFYDNKNGITVGPSGECHYTENAGKSWPSGTNFSACRYGLEIVDAKIAWHCGNGGHVRLSMDGGHSWMPVADFGRPTPNQCRFLSFVDDQTGWIASPYGMMAKTIDGATTWNAVKLPEGMDDIAAISLLTKDIGYILDMSGMLYKTNDGGQTWSSSESGFKDAPMAMKLLTPQEAMRFIDEKHGVIVACLNDDKVYASITTDGGKTWKREKIPGSMGPVFLSRDGRTLTVNQSKVIRVYQRSTF